MTTNRPLQSVQDEKLSQLKRIIQSYPDLMERIIQKFQQASSVEKVWFLLIRYGLFEVFKDIILNRGILPISAELSLLQEDRREDCVLPINGWCFLLQSFEGTQIFQELLNKNILPTSKALSILCNEPEKGFVAKHILAKNNGWGLLLRSAEGIQIFQDLLNRNILPSQRSLSISMVPDDSLGSDSDSDSNSKYAPEPVTLWCLLFKDPIKYQKLLRQFVEKNILPAKQDLLIGHMERISGQKKPIPATDRAWYWLARSSHRYKPNPTPEEEVLNFCYLIKKGIIPTKAVLSSRYSDYTNAWYWLLKGGESKNAKGFQLLLDAKIFPEVNDLMPTSDDKERNLWIELGEGPEKKLTLGILKENLQRKEHFFTIKKFQDAIVAELKSIKLIRKKYNCTDNQLALFARNDLFDFYGVLYLFYSAMIKPKALKAELLTLLQMVPIDIWKMLLSYLLPNEDSRNPIISALTSTGDKEKNAAFFAKFHIAQCLTDYSKKYPFLSERARSLGNAVQKSNSPGPLLFNQLSMASRGRVTPYQEPVCPYQKPYEAIVEDGDFYQILREGHSFFANTKQIKKGPVVTNEIKEEGEGLKAKIL